ncbi:hypothetical protein V5N11_010349 [Cardamine amara subsp. amara]|uniref:Reverse transcriptase zinc-binding domain-containing protein n=1 Tax=Cardamine amara subsp. amara TaxID=228776 RepID=A0ABD0ZIE1_CARAN
MGQIPNISSTLPSRVEIGKQGTHEETATSFSWSSDLWNVKTSPKLKTFMWKVVSKVLSVGTALANRGIEADTRCKVCREEETALGVFITCLELHGYGIWYQLCKNQAG